MGSLPASKGGNQRLLPLGQGSMAGTEAGIPSCWDLGRQLGQRRAETVLSPGATPQLRWDMCLFVQSVFHCWFMQSRYQCAHFTDEEIKTSRDKGICFQLPKVKMIVGKMD